MSPKFSAMVVNELRRPFVLLKPSMFLDGNEWCALYGDNIQTGVCGFGSTPNEAARNFDAAWFGISDDLGVQS